MSSHYPNLRRRWALGTALVAGLLTADPARAQVSLYSFQNVAGAYAPLTGGTPFSIFGGGGFDGDDAYSAPIALPFAFPFSGGSYSSVIVNSNGFLGLGGTANSTNFQVEMFSNAAAHYNQTIAFAGIDLKNTATVYRWQTDGSAPNRIWKLEASNFDRFNGAGQTGSAQVWLYEGSGQIDIVYGTFSNLWDPAFLSFEVGLRDSGPTDIKTIGGTWAAPVASAAATTITTSSASIPSVGQTFRFALPTGVDLVAPTLGAVSLTPPGGACVATDHVVSVRPTDPSGIASAAVSYSVNGGSPVVVPLTNAGGDWSGTIPAQGRNTVTYTVSATDASPQANVATSPSASYADEPTAVVASANQTTISAGSTVTLSAAAATAAGVKITEITLNGGGTGNTSPRPAYIGANEDEIIEISNTSPAPISLSGWGLAVRSTGSASGARTYTLPAGAQLPGNGVLLVHLGPGTDDVANRYFHSGGTNDAFFSGSDVGIILTQPSGTVVDAVALNGHSFSAPVTTADWSTPPSIPSTSGTAGASLRGLDLNNGTHWVVASATDRQTLGTYNSGISDAPLPTVTWTGGVLTGAVAQNPLTTPAHPTPGTYTYTASYTANGCTATDNVVITVVAPVAPVAAFTASATTASVGSTIITFTDQSTNLPNAWQWSFTPNTVTFVSGTSATSQNPAVTFDAPGCYTVALTASNGGGSDTETKANFVCAALSYCTTNLQQNACVSFGNFINTVSIAGTPLNNANTGCNGPLSYVSWPATGATTATLVGGQTYSLAVTTNSVGTTAAWLDGNANGQLEASEFILVQASGPPNAPATVQFTVPATTPGGQVLLRIRNGGLANSISATDACVLRFTGETEDYTVTLQAGCANPPLTGFTYGGLTGNAVCQTTAGTLPVQLAPDSQLGTFTATPAGLTLDAATGTVTPATSAPGTYTVTNAVAASGACPASASSVTFTIAAPVTATFSYDNADYCLTGLIDPTPTVTGTRGGTFSTTPTGLTIDPLTGQLTLASSTPGTYDVVYAVAGACSAADTVVVTVVAPPSAAFAYTATTQAICPSSGPLPVLLAPGAVAGTFTSSGLGLILDPITGTIDPAASAAGSYTVTNTVAAANGCAAVQAGTFILIDQRFDYQIQPSATTICQGDTAVLTAVDSLGFRGIVQIPSYQWLLNGSPILGADSAIYLATLPGAYTVSVTSPNGCPYLSNPVTITVNPQQTAGFSYPSATICRSGANPVANISGTAGGTFTATPAGLPINAATGEINLTTAASGTYAVVYTTAGPCAASDTVSVTITDAPSAAFSYATGGQPVCVGAAGTVTPTLGAGASVGTFSATPAGLTLNAATGAVTPATSAVGTYTIRNVIAASGSCAASRDSVTLVIEAVPVADVSADGPTSFCIGDSVTLTATGGGTYAWSTGATTASITVVGAGAYAVTVTNNAGCTALSDTVRIEVTPRGNATFAYGAPAYCAGSTTTVAANIGGTAGGTFSATPAGLALDAATGAIDLATSAVGSYTVQYAVRGACGDSTTQTLAIEAAPVVAITNLIPSSVGGYCQNAVAFAVQGTANGTVTTGNITIDGTAAIVFDPAELAPGNRTVIFTNTGGGLCASSDTVVVTIIPLAPAPTITVTTLPTGVVQLTSSAATGNQWYFNGTLLVGATDPTYFVGAAAQNGDYCLASTLPVSCAPGLVCQTVTVLGAAEALATSLGISLYPVPTTDGWLTLELPGQRRAAPVAVFDLAGRCVWRTELPAATGTRVPHSLDVRVLPVGVYVLRVSTEAGVATRRLVRE